VHYLSVSEARSAPGLRLVLSVGVPGPWGEAAKSLFHVKRIPFLPVRQVPGMPNEELVEWTGHANAPVAVYDDEAPRAAWRDILELAERLGPSPRLLPEDPVEKEQVLDLAHALCGEEGFGWCRRLMMVDALLDPGMPEGARRSGEYLGERYGYTKEKAAEAPHRAAEILRRLGATLRSQRERGRDFLVGSSLTAADLYWAAFAAMVEPMPVDRCPMPEMIRAWYSNTGPVVAAAIDPALLDHRDRVYGSYLPLPMSF
jgi:glutathione S-transferase